MRNKMNRYTKENLLDVNYLIGQYVAITKNIDLAEEKFGVFPTDEELREVAMLAKAIKALGGKLPY
jgi:hypothetical protein